MIAPLLILTPETFARFAKMVYDRAGISLSEEKRTLLSNRLRARLRTLRIATFEEYLARFTDARFEDEELPYFLSAVTTNETYFFRNERLWEQFSDVLLPEFIRNNKGKSRSISIWSAASSSGEEAYTAAILLREGLIDLDRWRVQVVGTDISRKVLEKAQSGLYGDYAVSKMSPERKSRWFVVEGDQFRLKEEIRKMVRFEHHNLRDSFRKNAFDLVLLRNVLMYFDTEVKQRAIEVASDAVSPGGYLFIGDVDPVRTSAELNAQMKLEPLSPGLYRKPANKPSAVGAR